MEQTGLDASGSGELVTGSCKHGNNPWDIKGKEFPNKLGEYQFDKKESASWCQLYVSIMNEHYITKQISL